MEICEKLLMLQYKEQTAYLLHDSEEPFLDVMQWYQSLLRGIQPPSSLTNTVLSCADTAQSSS